VEAGLEQPSEKYQVLIIIALVFVAAVGAALWSSRAPTGEPLVIERSNATVTAVSAVPRSLKVYVTGAVLRPGVYTLPGDARVEDVVNAAGGLAIDADRGRLNLASPVVDGQRIDVPAFRASLSNATDGGGPSDANKSGKVNINTASAADLDKLPTIGEVTANKIVSYREGHGPFKRIEDLKDLKLLRSESDFEQIKELITAE
jgi:competence protein ComEA